MKKTKAGQDTRSVDLVESTTTTSFGEVISEDGLVIRYVSDDEGLDRRVIRKWWDPEQERFWFDWERSKEPHPLVEANPHFVEATDWEPERCGDYEAMARQAIYALRGLTDPSDDPKAIQEMRAAVRKSFELETANNGKSHA
jgi:hypothetical protein